MNFAQRFITVNPTWPHASFCYSEAMQITVELPADIAYHPNLGAKLSKRL